MTEQPEIVTDEMRATCREAREKIIELCAERDRYRLALSVALPLLRRHGEDRTCILIENAIGYGAPAESVDRQMIRHGLVLVVDNERSGS